MNKVLQKYKKGTKISFGKNEAVVSSELMKFNEFYYIMADITKNPDLYVCSVTKIHDNIAIILRDRELLKQMGLSSEERRTVYCHELGHVFSKNQSKDNGKERKIEDEVDADTFAVKVCKINPMVLKNALKKTYEYEISQIPKKKDLTQSRIERFEKEMSARKKNAENLINERKQKDFER